MLDFAPGSARHQVDIYLPSTSVDELGRRTGSDTVALANVPAQIVQLSALELIRARKIWSEATHQVRLVLYPDHGITSKHYLKFGTRTLHVGAIVDEDLSQVVVTLLCREET